MRAIVFTCLIGAFLCVYAEDIGLEGIVLSYDDLERIKKSKEPKDQSIKKALFWYQEIPTTGLRKTRHFFPPRYPYIPHFFTLWELAPHKGAGINVTLIDTAICHHQDIPANYESVSVVKKLPISEPGTTVENTSVLSQQEAHRASHGCHTAGIVSGRVASSHVTGPDNDHGISGLAPEANVKTIAAFDSDGTSKKSLLISALKKAQTDKADVVNLGLKVADTLNLNDKATKCLEGLINAIPFTVVASGNDPKKGLSYPARFEGVSFDVGAFRYDDTGDYSIFPFSQYEPGVGPLFVAPGFNILSSGISTKHNGKSGYIFMGGTSMASAIMTGFVALMLGEFKKAFTREQLLTVSYASAIKMHSRADWNERVVLGVIDMRTALFTLHCLNRIRRVLGEKKLIYDFNANFEQLIQAIRYILFRQIDRYFTRYLQKKPSNGIRMRRNYADFLKQSLLHPCIHPDPDIFIPSSLEKGIAYIIDIIIRCVETVTGKREQKNSQFADEICEILSQKESKLFLHLGKETQERVRKKLMLHTKV